MFGPDHYVPVLKVKRGEKRALMRLTPPVARWVTPLLEIVERKPTPTERDPELVPTVDKHLDTAFRDLKAAVAPFGRYFLDCREIAADGHAAAKLVFERASKLRTPFTPVTSVTRTADIAAALSHRTMGLALRLSRDEFESGTLPRAIPTFLREHGLLPRDVDLIVDLGAIDQMVAPGVEALAAAFLADVPHHRDWRTLTLSACAFPSSMAVVSANAEAHVDRLEWMHWLARLHAHRGKLARLPTFSDCGIQHRDGVEGFDARKMHASAAIRFTEQSRWLLVKGESLKNTPGRKQFPGLAAKLLRIATPRVARHHCEGCAGAHSAASGATGVASPEKWRELGTIHHITETVKSLGALRFP